MIFTNKHIILHIVTVFTVTMFFSCKNNFKEVQKIGISEHEPIGVAENINLKYTDSGKIKANLISPKMLDYSNRDFAFSEFPGKPQTPALAKPSPTSSPTSTGSSPL